MRLQDETTVGPSEDGGLFSVEKASGSNEAATDPHVLLPRSVAVIAGKKATGKAIMTITVPPATVIIVKTWRREHPHWSFQAWVSERWRAWRREGMPPYSHETESGRVALNIRMPVEENVEIHHMDRDFNFSAWVDNEIRTHLVNSDGGSNGV